MAEDLKEEREDRPGGNPAEGILGSGVPVEESALARLRAFLVSRPEAGAVVATVVVFVVFSLWTEHFLTDQSLISVTTLSGTAGIVAIGVTLLMIGGEFDLSVGSIWGLSAVFVPSMMSDGIPSWIAVVLMLTAAVAIGVLHGAIVVKIGIPSFIVTLAGLMFWRGVVFVSTGGFPRFDVEVDDAFFQIFSYKFANGVPISIVWLLGLVVILTLMLQRTRFGNWIFATGGNKLAARQSGVPVDRVKVMLFGLTSGLAALGGIMQMTTTSTVAIQRGFGVELEAIAATVIGGTLLFGGYGSVVGTVLGVLMLAMIQNGLILVGISGYWFEGFLGLLILITVMINTAAQRRALGVRGEY